MTIATVNNADMIIMQKLAPKWEAATGNKLNWVVLEENVLRQRVTTDIATKGGQFDIITIGSYETPIWGKQGWLVPLDDLGDDYDYADMIPSVMNGLSYDGKLYAVPFYAESSFTFYRKDLFEQAGITMPEKPTYDQIAEYAAKLTDKSKEQYGFCQRGKPGWGENMAFVGPMVNAFGGQWFDMEWKPQLTSEPWKTAVTYYVENMNKYGPPGATANGHNENRALFATGHCAMWVDATSAAGYIFNPKESQVADKTAFAPAPIAGDQQRLGLVLGLGARHPELLAEGRCRQGVREVGDLQGVHHHGRRGEWLGLGTSRHAQVDLRQSRSTRRPRRSRRWSTRRSPTPTSPSRPRTRCPISASSTSRSPSSRASARTVGQQIAAALAGQVDGRPGAGDRAARGRADDEAGRLPQVS